MTSFSVCCVLDEAGKCFKISTETEKSPVVKNNPINQNNISKYVEVAASSVHPHIRMSLCVSAREGVI